MLKFTTLFFVLTIFSVKVSAQATATATVSATIVESVGATVSNDIFESRLSEGSYSAGIKTASATRFSNKDQGMDLHAVQKIDVAGFTLIGSAFDYAVTLPAEEIKLVQLQGDETLRIESFQMILNKTANKNANYQSIVIQAVCKPHPYQLPGKYFSPRPIDIIINYN